ncbi:biotin synthase BioB, partial [Alkalihalophilus lindianensis]|nr:biotin synthase BioB [Alkalihalophilus lindianensis]
MEWIKLAKKVMGGYSLTKEEAKEILLTSDDDILSVINAAYEIRRYYYGNKVKLNLIINAKSGLCPEDCGYCA